MTESEKKSETIKKNQTELWQTQDTPMTNEMIFDAVKKEYPKMFQDDCELVKLTGGETPVFKTQRRVTK